MSDPASRLRLIPGGDAPRRRHSRPGPAVLLVLVYATLFAAGLWLIRARTKDVRRARAAEAAPQKAGRHSRAELLAGAWIPAALRPRYFARLAAECCTCGCDLSVHDCLEGDVSCSRSPEIAEEIGRSLSR
ncbi:MAG TPA: hypothetical protein VIZ69_00235 [Thermoanaerobaculia bacterium]